MRWKQCHRILLVGYAIALVICFVSSGIGAGAFLLTSLPPKVSRYSKGNTAIENNVSQLLPKSDTSMKISEWFAHHASLREKVATDLNKFVVADNQSGITVSQFLQNQNLVSGKAIKRLCKDGFVSVNDDICFFHNHHLLPHDHVTVNCSDMVDNSISIFSSYRYQSRLLNYFQSLIDESLEENIRIRVLYEDDQIAILFKPAGIHSSPYLRTLQRNIFTFEDCLPLLLDPSSSSDSLLFPRVCHRLDYRVSGCIIAAKTTTALISINKQFECQQVSKEYRAIVVGNFNISAFPSSIIDEYSENSCGKIWKITTGTRSSRSTTLLQILETTPCNIYGSMHRVSLYPITGKRHQLRQHCALLGCPILGDDLYHFIGQVKSLEDRMLLLADFNLQHHKDGDNSKQKLENSKGVSFRKKVGLCLSCVAVSCYLPGNKVNSNQSKTVSDIISKIPSPHQNTSDSAHLASKANKVVVNLREPIKFSRIMQRALSGAHWQVQNCR